MKKTRFTLSNKMSVSLCSLVERKSRNIRPSGVSKAYGFSMQDSKQIHETDRTPVLIETNDVTQLLNQSSGLLSATERLTPLGPGFVSGRLGMDSLSKMSIPSVDRIQSKKRSLLHLNEALPDIRLVGGGNRVVAEDGTGVLIGIIDSGFDLSHPAFRDAAGRLRVDALLDQLDNSKEFDNAQLEAAWAPGGARPGADTNGHGTHVAHIAGGSAWQGMEGVAPGARFLLVRTDFQNTDEAVNWVFQQAKGRPCVINMSLGHHFGAHDGTDVEERLHNAILGPGKIIVVSAGNERQSNIHVGGNFHQGQAEEVLFDVARLASTAPLAILTLWHDNTDSFTVRVVTPSGQLLEMPQLGNIDHYSSSSHDIEYAVRNYTWSNSIQIQLSLSFMLTSRDRDLQDWRLRIACDRASVGRIDGWFHNSGFGSFRTHRLLENSRTVGLPATGQSCITVASYITRTSWLADGGPMDDVQAVLGRASGFSSQGPTRDGRWKPEISAPGQYITAALADRSELSQWDERSLDPSRLLTIEGTSMAAPVITGTVALLLQKRPQLSPADAKELLQSTARHDVHSGPAAWNPAYGHGKVDVQAALQKLSTIAAIATAAGAPGTP